MAPDWAHEVKDNLVQQISTLSTNPTTESSGSLLMPGRHFRGSRRRWDTDVRWQYGSEPTVATTAAANPVSLAFRLQIQFAWRLPYPITSI